MLSSLFTSSEHYLYNQKIPIKVLHRRHDIYDQDIAYHSHEFMELVVVTEGCGTHSICLPNEKTYSYNIGKGCAFIINIGETHNYIFENNEYLVVENIIFDPTVISYLSLKEEEDKKFLDFIYQVPQLPLEIRFSNNPLLNDQQFNRVYSLICMINDEQNKIDMGDSVIQLLLLGVILSYILRRYMAESNYVQVTSNPQSVNILRLVGYIQQHFCDDITLEDLAAISYCSTRHLTRQFKKITGETVMNYIRQLRIVKTCRLLQNTDMKISEIALKTGFNSCSFFTKIFKETTGITPVEYRLSENIMYNKQGRILKDNFEEQPLN